ncbi:MAG TPA: 2-oxoacid:acceptor oxidoreductase family protein [Candidatus Omnitrophota bacterium]|nr:2-oxoacid:acceptor oxidoreductase family protein [Candidatus Omnitrophota bacterium]HPD84264.1 2-oxoacid:acceptor oxidoreductase family protein [Candidatus Omnitrophota bacterium]HRZ03120.1 2-oxoacid:acceptor oxidoreductase family protein [Candidatus Omnitrophota bacterium]
MKKIQITDVIFYGVGGQGVLTAAEVMGWAALLNGHHVKKTEVHGMAQRGGSVESFIRFGKQVYSPLPVDSHVDFLVCLHPEEHVRFKDNLKPRGVDLIKYLEKAREAVADKKQFTNTFMLGVLSHYLSIPESCWLTAMEKVFHRSIEENKAFFAQGRKMGGSL